MLKLILNFNGLLIWSLTLVFPVIAAAQNSEEPAYYAFRNIADAIEEAIALSDAANYKAADLILTDIIDDKPTLQAYFLRASTREALNKNESALHDYLAVIDLNRNHFEAHYNAGEIYLRSNRPAQALTHFEILLKLPSQATQSVYYRQSFSGEGIDGIESRNERPADIHHKIAQAYMGLDEYQRAQAHVEEAIAIAGDNADFYLTLGNIFEVRSLTTQALNQYKYVLKIAPNHPLALYNLSALALKSEDADAKTVLSETVALYPEFEEAWLNLGYLYYKEGSYEIAITHYDKVIALDGNNVGMAILNKAKAKTRLKQFEEATGLLSQLDETGELSPEVANQLGIIRYQQKAYGLAVESLLLAKKLGYVSPSLEYHLGLSYHGLKNKPLACQHLENAKAAGLTQATEVLTKVCQ